MFILVYFHGRPAHTLTMVYFQGWPAHTCSSWSIFRGDLPIYVHRGLFSRATGPHTHTSLFLGATGPHTHTVYFHGQPTHKCSSWSIFKGDRPTYSHGLFSWVTCPYTHSGLFSRATFHTLTLVYFHGRPAHTYSLWSIFKGTLPFRLGLPKISSKICVLPVGKVWTCSFFFENFLMVGFFSFFFPFQGYNNDSLLLLAQWFFFLFFFFFLLFSILLDFFF